MLYCTTGTLIFATCSACLYDTIYIILLQRGKVRQQTRNFLDKEHSKDLNTAENTCQRESCQSKNKLGGKDQLARSTRSKTVF